MAPKLAPEDIDLRSGFINTFGKREVERAAVILVKFLRDKNPNKFETFTFEELVRYHIREKLSMRDMLYGLLGSWFDDSSPGCVREDPGYILHWGDELQLTERFFDRIRKFSRKEIHAHNSPVA